jgi:arsenate reductase
MSPEKKKVLFICAHNSARSQMAEAFLNALPGVRHEASSGGTEPGTVNPYVVTVMKEIGFDLSSNRAKSIDEFAGRKFDLVVTLCSQDQEACPFFPGAAEYEHREFDDPAACAGTEEEILSCVRRIRDEVREWVGMRFQD